MGPPSGPAVTDFATHAKKGLAWMRGEGALGKPGTAPPAPWNCLGPDLETFWAIST